MVSPYLNILQQVHVIKEINLTLVSVCALREATFELSNDGTCSPGIDFDHPQTVLQIKAVLC